MNIDEYLVDFQQNIALESSLAGDYTTTGFVRYACNILLEAGQFDNFEAIQFEGVGSKNRKLRVHGYDVGASDNVVSLMVAIYGGQNEVRNISSTEANSFIRSLSSFAEDAISGHFEQGREASSEAVQAAMDIRHAKGRISRIRLHLLTDGKFGSRFKDLTASTIDGIPVDYSYWDIERFYNLQESSLQRVPLEINLTDWSPQGLGALEVPGSERFSTYLSAVPGRMLAELYAQYGNRLLESNVRAYLSNRGTVNKGIRETISATPELFMAYNNGITATASRISLSPDRQKIEAISDLQIVNGGQTTASLFYVNRDKGLSPSLDNVSVPMKLVVVDVKESEMLVPNISKFANSQNAVNAADFFSNSPYHQRMEDLSRRIRIPAVAGSRVQPKWYYERIRGQYSNERTRRTPAEALKFENENPKTQMFTKTDLAKYIVSWERKPHIVSRGAQKNFIAFAELVATRWEKSPDSFNETYYKECIAKAILFIGIRKAIAKSTWYQQDPGYLANIVAYTVSVLSNILGQDKDSELDFLMIWQNQKLSSDLLSFALDIAQQVRRILVSEQRLVQNVTEWAKREDCWKVASSLRFDLPPTSGRWLISSNVAGSNRVSAKRVQRIDDGIMLQSQMVSVSAPAWDELLRFAKAKKVGTEKELSILMSCLKRRSFLPTEPQAVILSGLISKANKVGFDTIVL